ncbi:MAG TPA: OsmC family protein [Gemmatimonadaceae bacterium]|nr:OsmC family protein [Gemmatimonadaceae bacterium]
MSDMTSVYSSRRHAPPIVEPKADYSLSIRLYADYEQVVDFRMPGVAVLGLDECPPAGHGWGPSPAHLVGAALGACLGARLLAWLRERGVDVDDMRTDVTGSFGRGADGERRIAGISVQLSPIMASTRSVAMISPAELRQGSIVAQSLAADIDLNLSITPEVRVQPPLVPQTDGLSLSVLTAAKRKRGGGWTTTGLAR